MSDYAGPVLGAVGAVIGFYVGGAAGAQWGWAIGSAIGGAYAQSQQVIPGPKIGDVQRQTSQEGGFRPIVYGRSMPIAGNVIADGGPEIVKKEERQGKGGPKVETEYAYRTYAVGFCEGETTLLQAWRNGILVYDAEDPSMASENAKFLEYATWYTGAFDQMPDPDLEGIYGAGNTPAFRGTAYLAFAREDVTDLRGSWSQWQVRVFRGAAKSYTTPPYPAYATDSIQASSSVERALFWQIETEMIDASSSIVSADLVDMLELYSTLPEGIDALLSEIVSGTLVDLIDTYNTPPEGIDAGLSQIVSVALDDILILYQNWPPEGVDASSSIVAGTLT